MKVNTKLLKGLTRIILILILFVILCMLSAFLYTVRYWPDVMNYINANITITKIQTISELNITVITVNNDNDFTTEGTTDFTSTTEFYDDFTDFFEDFFDDRKKRAVIEDASKDYIELPKNVVVHYVFTNIDSTTEMKDLVDETDLTTRDGADVETFDVNEKRLDKEDFKSTIDASEVSPFISTIYIRANSTNHFDYVCDGAVISKNVIITAARCVSTANGTISAGDVLVILGKRSLVESGDGEKMFRVKQVQLHQNFSRSTNDLALLLLEDITFSDVIKTINVTYEEYSPASEAITTGWALSGDLTVIPFDYDKSAECNKNKQDATLFCATYGHGISFCPSYGGLYMTKTGTSWTLQGIRNGDNSERTICMNNNVMYTPLNTYEGWIRDFVNRY